MKLYMHPVSITSRPVRLLIAEKGLAVDEEVVDLFTGAHHQEPFISINPNRLVPVLEDGDFRLTESSAILKYLAELHNLPEYPKDLKRRARVNEIMSQYFRQPYPARAAVGVVALPKGAEVERDAILAVNDGS